MKTCPRCGKSYPDNESFCEADGTALVSARISDQPAQQTPADAAGAIDCPVCGGKAEPGEVICNFCGTRLVPDSTPTPPPLRANPPPSGPTRASPETFVPSRGRSPTGTATRIASPGSFDAGAASGDESLSEGDSGARRPLTLIAYIVAALLALAGGAWLALHLSSHPEPQVAASPIATSSPVAAGPVVTLASTIPLQTIGASASDPARTPDAARKLFDDNKDSLLSDYRNVLSGGAAVDDGMMARLTVEPDGSVSSAAIRVSTSPNPALDAAVAGTMGAWHFMPFSGGEINADYPLIFTRDPAQAASIESSLSAKLAGLGPSETPEYATTPATPTVVPSVAPLPPPTPAPAPLPALVPPTGTPPRHHRRPVSARPPSTTLLHRVQGALAADPRFRRVKCYTSGTAAIIYGTVYGDKDKLAAQRAVQRVSGVSDVVNNIQTDTSKWATQESTIRQALAAAGLTGVTVKVIGRDAFLNGTVNSNIDKERAATIATGAAPVKVQMNMISVAPGKVFGF
ncbi:MAG TPA: BON domain-containing protein [Candidatus Binataceae bacterium]|nr:BON domain-containing protein [Candidatus Binataceae bacterium]